MAIVEGVYDVVVVGAGIMGSCVAYEVAKRGNTVLLLEQFDFLHKRGSSHGESRTLRLTYPEPYYTFMAKRSLQLWKDAEKDAGYRVYTQTGQLDIGTLTNPGIQAMIASCTKHGISHQVLESHPAVAIPPGNVLVHTEEAGVLRATKAVAMFQALALKHGAVLRDQVEVISISHGWKGESLVATTKGSALATKCVVFAAGPWTNKIIENTGAGLKDPLPITPLHTFISYWQIEDEAAKAYLSSNQFPAFANYEGNYIYGTPSLEYPGLIKIAVHGGFPCDPDKRNHALSFEPIRKELSSWIAATFEGRVRSEAPVMVEGCLYSMTPDQDFILDFLPGSGNKVLVAAGFSGHGFKMGPVVGKILADLALEGSSNEDVSLEWFSLSRFEGGSLGNQKGFDPVKEMKKLTTY